MPNPIKALIAVLLALALLACRDQASDAQGNPSDATPQTAPADALVLPMIYGSEKQAWIEAVTKDFNAQNQKSTTGKSIRVEAVPLGSTEALERILDGSRRPVIWSPASRLLLPVANKRWAQTHAGAKLTGDSPPLVLSPVVIAMWKPMAQALGWPQKPLGWSDIAALARNGKSWKDFGHPEWGAFQFGHTHPDFSNSGISSILSTVYAASGKTEDLSLADVNKPAAAQVMADVERNVIHYGESTGFFAKQMFTRGPAYLSAAVLYENLVVESYDRTKYPDMPFPVVAIYPKDGTFFAAHPFAVLNAPWVTDEARAAAETYRTFLMSEVQQRKALEFGFRPAGANVFTGAPIDAAHGVNPKEPRVLLQAPNADVIEATRALWGRTKKRVEVEVVLDTSGSMKDENRLGQAKAALSRFISRLDDEDYLGVTTFSSTAVQLTEVSKLGPKRKAVQERLNGLFPNGGTRLIDTVLEAYGQVQARPSGQRIRAVVVLTDGTDNGSSAPAETLLERLKADDEGRAVKVFTIAYGTGTDVNVDFLKNVAQASGAKSYSSDPTRIDQVYRDIATFF